MSCPRLLQLPAELRARVYYYATAFDDEHSNTRKTTGKTIDERPARTRLSMRQVNRAFRDDFDSLCLPSLMPAVSRALQACSRDPNHLLIATAVPRSSSFGPMPPCVATVLTPLVARVGPTLKGRMSFTLPIAYDQTGSLSFRRERDRHIASGGVYQTRKRIAEHFHARCDLVVKSLQHVTEASAFRVFVPKHRPVEATMSLRAFQAIETKRDTLYDMQFVFSQSPTHHDDPAEPSRRLPLQTLSLLEGATHLRRLDLSAIFLDPFSVVSFLSVAEHLPALSELHLAVAGTPSAEDAAGLRFLRDPECLEHLKLLTVRFDPSWSGPYASNTVLYDAKVSLCARMVVTKRNEYA